MDNEKAWSLADTAITSGARTVLLAGPPGAGKTWLAMHARYRDTEAPAVHALTLTPDTPAAELRGHYLRKGEDHVWHDGIAVRAWRLSHQTACRLVLNEIQDVGPDAESMLLAFADSADCARYMLPSGEEITPGASYQLVATMNGDPEILRDALRDRFDAIVQLPGSHPAAFEGLPSDIRPHALAGDLAREDDRITLRRWYAFVSLRMALGLAREADAATLAFGAVRAPAILDSLRVARS